jgi:cytochrome c oxidase subunit 2
MRTLAAIVLLLAPCFTAAVAQPNLEAGRRIYDVCAGCHGFRAEGNALVNAPRLAGVDSWYLARQMRNFTAGVRGAASGDAHGQRMAPMARAVRSERELEDLIAYIETLPENASAPTVTGNIEEGGRRYAICAACHGLQGEGNPVTSSPRLVALDDWYVVEQLRLYAEGLRGSHAEDLYGQQMRAVVGTFSDEQARRDLAVYIMSLDRLDDRGEAPITRR